MTMSIASLNSNMALSVYNKEISLIAVFCLILLNAVSPASSNSYFRRYMPDEPGVFDPKKNRPVHHLKKERKKEHIARHKLPRENNTVVTTLVGTTALLKCNVGLNNVTVIWVKHEVNTSDVTVLTANSSTLIDDKRFLVTNDAIPTIWILHIRYVTRDDQGLYECQVCNYPTFSIYVRLELFEAHAIILGPSLREVDRGFPIRLSCILNSTHHYRMVRPTYMFWYHDSRMINYDLKDGAVVREGRLGTELIFQRALPQHAGNYSCVPSNARQASVQVIVHYPGEHLPPSLPFHSDKGSSLKKCPCLTLLLLLLPLVFTDEQT